MTFGLLDLPFLGSRVSALRKDKKLTQDELAKLVGVTQGAIAQIENNMRKTISAPTLLKLAAALEANPEWILTGKGDPKAMPQVSQESTTELVGLFEGMTEANKAALLAAAKALALHH